MKQLTKRLFACILALAVAFSFVPQAGLQGTVNAQAKAKYTVSESAGTVEAGTVVKVKAAKGFKVFYTTGSKFTSLKKVIKSGKTKKFTIKKTTTIKLFAVKSSKKITKKVLKKKKGKSYKFTVKTSSDSGSDSGSDEPSEGGTDAPPGEGGGSGSAGQEFGTFEEVSSYAKILVNGDTVTGADALTEGTVDKDGIYNATLSVTEGNGIAVTKPNETDKFIVDHCTIKVTSGSKNNDLGYEAAYGVGIGVETGELWITDSTLESDGPRSTNAYLFSTAQPQGTSLVVKDSTLKSHSDNIWMPPFKLLAGGARATLLMTRNNSWFYGSTVESNNWGAISQDSVDAYTYVVNSTGTVTEGGYATYLTYGMRLYGSQLYGAQYGVFMCGESDFVSDNGSVALTDETAMSKVPTYDVKDTQSEVVAPFNALVVHNSLPSLDMVAKSEFKNTLVSTDPKDLPSNVSAMKADDEFFMPGINIFGTNGACGASYFFNRNLYGSLALVRSMNADITFDNATTRSTNNVLIQSVVTYDPPQPCGILEVGEGESLPGITGTFKNGTYEGDILHQDYQRKMTIKIGENATLKGKAESYTYQGWKDLWSEESLTKALTEDGYTPDVFNNDSWVSDVQANILSTDNADYAATDNLGIDLSIEATGKWEVTGTSSLNSLTVSDPSSIIAPEGKTLKIYENCGVKNSESKYDASTGTLVTELTAGATYNNVVIVVE